MHWPRYVIAIMAFGCFACSDTRQPQELGDAILTQPAFTHVANNQTLHPDADSTPQAWFSIPEQYQYANPKVTYQAIDEPVSQSDVLDSVHACQCQSGCQTHRYAFSNYTGSGPIEVHDLNIRVDLTGCLDAFNFCNNQTVSVFLDVTYFIQGQAFGTRRWEHYAGGWNCVDDVFEASFSNLSFTRGQINTLEVQVKIGGTWFCENSTFLTIYSLEAECVAGEVHGGGCHCDPSG